MKDKYCVLNYNVMTKKWNVILKSPLINDFLEDKSKVKLINLSRSLAKKHHVLYYIYDKQNKIVEKSDYTKK